MIIRIALSITAWVGATLLATTVRAGGMDSASQTAYADGWQAGDNGGTGFGAWSFSFSGSAAALVHPAPRFIATTALAGNSLPTPAFALTTSDRPTFYDTSAVGRQIGPLVVGDVLRIDVDGSALDNSAAAYSTGNTIQLLGADGVERFGLFTNNRLNGNQWTTEGVATGVPAAGAFTLEFTLTAADAYNVALLPVGGGAPLYSRVGGTLRGTAGSAVTRIRISTFGTGSSSDGTKELFFNNLVVQSPAAASADFDGDTDVDGSDFLVWQRGVELANGATRSQGNADGDEDVDSEDLAIWKSQFGSGSTGGIHTVGVMPEPHGQLLAILACTAARGFAGRRTACRGVRRHPGRLRRPDVRD
jgi:hypothetical protein